MCKQTTAKKQTDTSVTVDRTTVAEKSNLMDKKENEVAVMMKKAIV